MVVLVLRPLLALQVPVVLLRLLVSPLLWLPTVSLVLLVALLPVV
jgi:hypothetical protein